MDKVKRNLAEKNAYICSLEARLQNLEGKEREWRQTAGNLAIQQRDYEDLQKVFLPESQGTGSPERDPTDSEQAIFGRQR
jgi:hypothetical protein